jgi:photosystem II stability/assembly factor-like uncharacterized protein
MFKKSNFYYFFPIILFILTDVTFSQTVFWEPTNGPGGGYVNDVYVGKNGDIFAGSSTLGILVSSDKGENWTQINNGLEFDGGIPGINNIIDGINNNLYTATNRGVFRSTDNGGLWVLTSNGLPANSLGPLPVLVLEVNSAGELFAAGLSGLLHSNNSGDDWNILNNELSDKTINALLINSNDDIFAGTNDAGIFFSSDGGNTWSEKNNGLSNTEILSLVLKDNGDLFAGTGNGVFRSSDNADTWTHINTGMVNSTAIHSLLINSGGVIFAGTEQRQVYRSADNGENWTRLQEGITISVISDLESGIDGELFAATRSDGIFRSTNSGDSWSAINSGLRGTSVRTVAISPDQVLFASTEVRGIFRSTDDGLSWAQINTNLENSSGRAGWINDIAFNSSGDIFIAVSPIPNAGGFKAGVFRSSNAGDEWVEINNGLTSFSCLSLTTNSNDHLFVGTRNGVFRSTDNGENWTETNTGLGGGGEDVFSLAVNSVGDIFAGTDGSGVFRSVDNGENWNEVNSGLTEDEILSLAINSEDIIFAGTTSGIFRSSDNGDNWERAVKGLPSDFIDINELAINSQNDIYAATPAGIDNGVYVSTNNGEEWVSISSGLPVNLFGQLRSIHSIAVKNGDEVFIGTDGAGVYKGKSKATSIGINSLIRSYSLYQNYPNPFNPNTTISWQSPIGSHQTLKVYDLLGREVATLVDEFNPAGNYKVEFDASNLSSGTYFYRLTTGEFVETKKLILMK